MISNNGYQGFIGQDLIVRRAVSHNESEEEPCNIADSERSRDLYKRVGDLSRMNIQSKRVKELQDEAQRTQDHQRMNLIRPDKLIASKNLTRPQLQNTTLQEVPSLEKDETGLIDSQDKMQIDSKQESRETPCFPIPPEPQSILPYQLLDRKQKIASFQKKQNSRSRLQCRSLDIPRKPKSDPLLQEYFQAVLARTENDSDSSIERSLISCSCSLCEEEGKEAPSSSSSSCIDSEGMEALEDANLEVEEGVANFQSNIRKKSFLKRVIKDHSSYMSNPENHIKALQEKDAKRRWTKRKRFIQQHSGKILCILIVVGMMIFSFYK